jgi:hypothetical protein
MALFLCSFVVSRLVSSLSQVAEMHAEYERQLQHEAEEAAQIQVNQIAQIFCYIFLHENMNMENTDFNIFLL